MNNLIFHYQTVIHNVKEGIYLHEAFSTKTGELYMLNPVPAEIFGESEDEVEITLKAMDRDSVKYTPVHINSVITQLHRWSDEVDINGTPDILYEDEEIADDFIDKYGEVIDICDYFERNNNARKS